MIAALGCATAPPSSSGSSPELSDLLVDAQQHVAQATNLTQLASAARQMALQAAQNAFAAEKESKALLIKTLNEGSIEKIQSASEEAEAAAQCLSSAIQMSSEIIQLETEARTSSRAAQRKLYIAMHAEVESDARVAMESAHREASRSIKQATEAIDLSITLKKKWLVRAPLPIDPPPGTPSLTDSLE